MMWSEEKLPIQVGLFYKVRICDAHLRMDRCSVQSIKIIAVIKEMQSNKEKRSANLS